MNLVAAGNSNRYTSADRWIEAIYWGKRGFTRRRQRQECLDAKREQRGCGILASVARPLNQMRRALEKALSDRQEPPSDKYVLPAVKAFTNVRFEI
jgi:hypothetical protein